MDAVHKDLGHHEKDINMTDSGDKFQMARDLIYDKCTSRGVEKLIKNTH